MTGILMITGPANITNVCSAYCMYVWAERGFLFTLILFPAAVIVSVVLKDLFNAQFSSHYMESSSVYLK